MDDYAIDVVDLEKRFGDVVAVAGLSFQAARGQITALLGGNGAGKTTTIGMLLGLVLPTGGQIRVLGVDMLKDRFRVLPRLNFSSPYVDLPHRLTVRQNLRVYAELYGLAAPAVEIGRLADDLQLDEFLDRKVGSLSAGQKTRVALAKALINDPDVLFLDEPTASLDPDTADWVRGYLKAYQARTNAAILLASHNMGEVERLAHDVLMLRRGELIDRGAPAALLAKYGRVNLEEVFLDIARGTGRAAAE